MRAISLDPLTIFSVPAPEFVDIAADLGCSDVVLWVNLPYPGLRAPVVRPDSAGLTLTLERLRARGLGVRGTECFNITRDFNSDAHRPALTVAARLGARAVTAIFLEDIDQSVAALKFGEFCDAAEAYRLNVTVEFMAISPSCNGLGKALSLIERSGRPNARVTLDFLHLVRTGGTAEDISRVDPALIGHVQICDGPLIAPPDQWDEMGANRMLPGDGEFPITEFLRRVPREIPIGIEIPMQREIARGVAPAEIARRCVEATRRALATADGDN